MTRSKKCVTIFLLWNFAFIWNNPVYLSVLKHAPAEYATVTGLMYASYRSRVMFNV